MTTDNPSRPLNTFPFVSEEMKITLRLQAWKDEAFRQELIADPKGVIQRLFPECFPNGKVPEQLTFKVIEEDQYTHHIVLPSFPDELLTPELPKSELVSQLPPLRAEVERILRLRAWKDETFRQELIADPKGVSERLFPECFPNGKVPEQLTFKVIEEDQYTKHIILPALPGEFLAPDVPEEIQLELIANMSCDDMTLTRGSGTRCVSCTRRCRGADDKKAFDYFRSQADGQRDSDESQSPEPKKIKPFDLIKEQAKRTEK